jgi:hypothetical protein
VARMVFVNCYQPALPHSGSRPGKPGCEMPST